MSSYSWIALAFAAATLGLAAVLSVWGILHSRRRGGRTRWTYARTLPFWVVGGLLWVLLGLVRCLVDGSWWDGSVITAGALVTLWTLIPSKVRVR